MAKRRPPSAPGSRSARTTPAHRFTFGLWTVGNVGRDPFGGPTRAAMSPAETVELLAEVGGVHGVNFHDNDLVPIDATPREARRIMNDFQKALDRTGIQVAMATTNLFADPVFKDGAFTNSDAEVRAYAVHKTMQGMELGARFGAEVYVFWGGREGAETDAARDPSLAEARFRRAINFLCDHSLAKGYGYRFALEAKPNEPRAHMYFATTGHYLALIPTLKHPEMVGVNPEVAHEHMAGLNFTHSVAQALAADKLFHIDLNDQCFGRFDQDLRFGSADIKSAFFLVKLLEDHGYSGYRHFDAHAYRTSDRKDVIEFARGCIRTYQLLCDKARLWNADRVVRAILREVQRENAQLDSLIGNYSPASADRLRRHRFDRREMASRPLPYERLDQRTIELLLGVAR